MTIRIRLARGRGFRVEAGHPWVYDNEIDGVDGEPGEGDVVDVLNYRGYFVGRGIANPNSRIRVRLLTRDDGEAIDAALFRRRIAAAWDLRRKIGYGANCRVVFSESDFLSGLIVDKFGDFLSVQILSLAMEKHRDAIEAALRETLKPKGILERSDAPVRALEGLPLRKGFWGDSFDTRVTIEEPDGAKFAVDLEGGQKTGFFLDQKENRCAIRPFVKGARVLDAFCYTGSFSVYAGLYGAESVTGLDQSAEAVALARENADLNGLGGRCEFHEGNAFDALNAWARGGERFDVVFLDPPAFTKNRAGLPGALRGYKDVNLRAMQILPPGGFLVTSSCSHFVSPDEFRAVIRDAAFDAGRQVREILSRHQSPDHPVLWGVEESLYLKFLVLQIL